MTMQPGQSTFPPITLIEHVIEQLEWHVAALRDLDGEMGSREAQARWLDIQADNLREALGGMAVLR